MGASNCLAAWQTYGGKVHATSLVVLGYMALVAMDKDAEPAYWDGHEMIAIRCFGYPEPVGPAGLRAVRRAITPLFEVGAITTVRHASGHYGHVVTAKYRLWLTAPAPDAKRPTPAASIGRKTVKHRTLSVPAQDAKRPTEEYEETEGARNLNGSAVNTTVEGIELERQRQLKLLDQLVAEQNGHKPTVDCPGCGRRVIIRLDGAIQLHRVGGHACHASGTVPA